MVMRLEIEKLKLQRQNDHNNNFNNVLEKAVEEEIIRVSKKKHIEDRATAILMDELRQFGGGHSMTMSVETKYEREITNCIMDATELDDDLSQSMDDRKSMGMRNIPSTMSKLPPTTPMDDKDIFEMSVVPPAPLLPSRPIPPKIIPTSIDIDQKTKNKCDTGSSSIASVDTIDSSDNKMIPRVPFLSSSVRVHSTMNTSSYTFRAIPPPMPPPDDTYSDDPFDIPLPPAPAVPSRPLPSSLPPPNVSNHLFKEEEEEEEDQPQNLVLVPLGSAPINSTDEQ